MKTILGLLFACCLLALVCARDGPTPYPDVFTAIYNASDIPGGLPPYMTTFYLDAPNKRARAALPFYQESGDYLLIFRPSGADPTSSYGKNYTQIVINPPNVNNSTKCLYQQIDDMGPWPKGWLHAANSQYLEEVGSFYPLPNDLQYTGPFFVAELGIWTDRWDSRAICKLFKSGIGNVPCNSVMYTQGPNPLPAMDIQAGSGGQFGDDSYYTRVYHTFKTSVSDSDFALPKDWQKRCGNADAGYNMSPSFPFIKYSDGTSNYKPSISLAVPPVQSLGPVTITFTPQPTPARPCTDCVATDVTLTFTVDNWNVPQAVPFTYHKPGCSNVQVQAKGGSYDWTAQTAGWTIYSCPGSASRGCDKSVQC